MCSQENFLNQIFAQNVIGNYVNQLKFDYKTSVYFCAPYIAF